MDVYPHGRAEQSGEIKALSLRVVLQKGFVFGQVLRFTMLEEIDISHNRLQEISWRRKQKTDRIRRIDFFFLRDCSRDLPELLVFVRPYQ